MYYISGCTLVPSGEYVKQSVCSGNAALCQTALTTSRNWLTTASYCRKMPNDYET